MRRPFYLSALLAGLFMAGCTAAVRPVSVESACLEQFEQLDARLVSEGMHDAGAYRLPDYPFLRVTRFWASFADELNTAEKRRTWLEALRELDQQAREIELQNLGVNDRGQLALLSDCGEQLVTATLKDPAVFESVVGQASVPDDYSSVARLLGLYPFAVPFMKLGISGYQGDILRDYAEPLDVPAGARLMSWAPESGKPTSVAMADSVNALGVPQISAEDWQQLFASHAPVWQVEVATDDDLPGRAGLSHTQPVIKQDEVVTYVRPAFTRFNGQVLLQLVYSLWFPRRTAEGSLDPYAGEFDAVIWRVTLDPEGKPLVYDTIHGCGCYHYFFTAQPLLKKPDDGYWQEPVLFPQEVLPQGRPVLRLAAGTHFLRRVLASADDQGQRRGYVMRPYRELLSLKSKDGARSLFSADGLLEGSERLERFWLWPSGVPSPGAMRQYGRHATAFIGRRHFDDAHLLDSLFVNPK